jgi:hypothetical protein
MGQPPEGLFPMLGSIPSARKLEKSLEQRVELAADVKTRLHYL